MLINNLLAIALLLVVIAALYGIYRSGSLLLQKRTRLSKRDAKITSICITMGIALIAGLIVLVLAANGISELPNQ